MFRYKKEVAKNSPSSYRWGIFCQAHYIICFSRCLVWFLYLGVLTIKPISLQPLRLYVDSIWYSRIIKRIYVCLTWRRWVELPHNPTNTTFSMFLPMAWWNSRTSIVNALVLSLQDSSFSYRNVLCCIFSQKNMHSKRPVKCMLNKSFSLCWKFKRFNKNRIQHFTTWTRLQMQHY